MTNKERDELAQVLIKDCLNLLRSKGQAYSGNDDVNSNFKKVAELLGLSKYQVWNVYFNKHIFSINNAIKDNPINPQDRTEGLYGRIIDAINYLIILASLLQEDTNEH